jgi:hypothetical protein
VIPVAQWGAQHILPPYTKRPHLLPRKTISMAAGEPVALDDLRDLPPTPEVLREATNRIMDEITRLLEEIRGDKAPTQRYDPRTTGVRQIGNPRPRTRHTRDRRRS